MSYIVDHMEATGEFIKRKSVSVLLYNGHSSLQWKIPNSYSLFFLETDDTNVLAFNIILSRLNKHNFAVDFPSILNLDKNKRIDYGK